MTPSAESIAYHEAGHAIVALACGFTVRSVSITPAAELRILSSSWRPLTREAAMVALAGNIAQARACPGTRGGEGVDQQIAYKAARFVHWSPPRLLARLHVRTRRLLDQRWHYVELIAAALLERGRLTGEEIDALFCRPCEQCCR